MQVIEVDWAGAEQPEFGLLSNAGDDVIVVAQLASAQGPSGHPVVRVAAFAGEGVASYREAMELDAWLETRYGVEDEDERQELLDIATVA